MSQGNTGNNGGKTLRAPLWADICREPEEPNKYRGLEMVFVKRNARACKA